MAITSTIHNERFPAGDGRTVGNIIAVIGIASQGPLDPTLVTVENYKTLYGKIMVDPTLLYDTTLDTDEREAIFNKADKCLVKTLSEIYELGDSTFPVVACRVGNPTLAGLSVYENQATYYATAIAVASAEADDDTITTSAAHGLKINDKVIFTSTYAGLTANTFYYVKSVPSTTTLTLAATPGGTIVSLTDATTTSMYKGIPSYDMPYADDANTGIPQIALKFTAKEYGDEYNYFYVKVEKNATTGYPTKMIISYTAPSSTTDTYGSVNVIDDSSLDTAYSIDLTVYNTVKKIKNIFDKSPYADYLQLDIVYNDVSYDVDDFNLEGSDFDVAMPYGSSDSFDLYEVIDITASADATSTIASGTSIETLDHIPLKTLEDSDKTITSAKAVVTEEINVADMTVVSTNHTYTVILGDESYWDGTDIAVSSYTVGSTTKTGTTGSELTISIPSSDIGSATTITVTYEYGVTLSEAKIITDRLTGSWNSYFVTEKFIMFGAETPVNLKLGYKTSFTLTEGADYVVNSYGASRTETDVIKFTLIPDSDNFSGLSTVDLTFNYQVYPSIIAYTGWQKTVNKKTYTQKSQLSGGYDGSELTESQYKTLVAKALDAVSAFYPTDVIVSGAYLDSTVTAYSAYNGIKQLMPVGYAEVLNAWTKNQAQYIRECRAYIATKPISFKDGNLMVDDIDTYLSKHYETDGTTYNPYVLRSNYNNPLMRFVVGDLITNSVSAMSNIPYRVNPAVVSLLMTRSKGYAETKVNKDVANMTTNIKGISPTVIEEFNSVGWELYGGVINPNTATPVVKCLAERTGSAVGYVLDSQHVMDTALLAITAARDAIRGFLGKVASPSMIKSLETSANKAVTDRYCPEPVASFDLKVNERTLDDQIKEQTRITITMSVYGPMRNFVLDTYVGIA